MAVTLDLQPGEPILLVKFLNPFDIKIDIPGYMQDLRAIYDAAAEPLVNITDVTGLKLSFGDIVAGMAILTKGQKEVILHRNAIVYIAVADSDMLRLAASALSQVQYGSIPIKVAKTLDEAIRQAREVIAARRAAAS